MIIKEKTTGKVIAGKPLEVNARVVVLEDKGVLKTYARNEVIILPIPNVGNENKIRKGRRAKYDNEF